MTAQINNKISDQRKSVQQIFNKIIEDFCSFLSRPCLNAISSGKVD